MESCQKLSLAKLKNSKTIHLCLTTNNELSISRCGLLYDNSRGQIEPVLEINETSILCKKCARDEGILYNKKQWFTEKDHQLESMFLDHVSRQKKNIMVTKDTQINPPHIYIAPTENLGRGVFSKKSFAKSEIVEIAPVFQLEEGFSDLPKAFQHRIFNWSKMSGSGETYAIALGYGSMYNHSEHPNLVWQADSGIESINFIARRNIVPNEQLTIHYEQEIDGTYTKSQRWFSKKGLDQHEI